MCTECQIFGNQTESFKHHICWISMASKRANLNEEQEETHEVQKTVIQTKKTRIVDANDEVDEFIKDVIKQSESTTDYAELAHVMSVRFFVLCKFLTLSSIFSWMEKNQANIVKSKRLVMITSDSMPQNEKKWKIEVKIPSKRNHINFPLFPKNADLVLDHKNLPKEGVEINLEEYMNFSGEKIVNYCFINGTNYNCLEHVGCTQIKNYCTTSSNLTLLHFLFYHKLYDQVMTIRGNLKTKARKNSQKPPNMLVINIPPLECIGKDDSLKATCPNLEMFSTKSDQIVVSMKSSKFVLNPFTYEFKSNFFNLFFSMHTFITQTSSVKIGYYSDKFSSYQPVPMSVFDFVKNRVPYSGILCGFVDFKEPLAALKGNFKVVQDSLEDLSFWKFSYVPESAYYSVFCIKEIIRSLGFAFGQNNDGTTFYIGAPSEFRFLNNIKALCEIIKIHSENKEQVTMIPLNELGKEMKDVKWETYYSYPFSGVPCCQVEINKLSDMKILALSGISIYSIEQVEDSNNFNFKFDLPIEFIKNTLKFEEIKEYTPEIDEEMDDLSVSDVGEAEAGIALVKINQDYKSGILTIEKQGKVIDFTLLSNLFDLTDGTISFKSENLAKICGELSKLNYEVVIN